MKLHQILKWLSMAALLGAMSCADVLEDESASDEKGSEESADATAELRSGFTIDGEELECKVLQTSESCKPSAEQAAFTKRCKDSGLTTFTCGCNQTLCSGKLPEETADDGGETDTADGGDDAPDDGGEETARQAPESFAFCKDLLEFMDGEAFQFSEHLYKWQYEAVKAEQAIDICATLGDEWRLPTAGESGEFIKIAKLVKKDDEQDLMYCGMHFWSRQSESTDAYIYRPYALNWFVQPKVDAKGSTLCVKAPPPEQAAEKCADAKADYRALLTAMHEEDNSCTQDTDCTRGMVPGLICPQQVTTFNKLLLDKYEDKMDGLAKVIADSCWVDNLTDVMCPAVAYPTVVKCVEKSCTTSFGDGTILPNGFPATP